VPKSPNPRPSPLAPRTLSPRDARRLTAGLLALAFLALALAAGLGAGLASPRPAARSATAVEAKAHVL
jgi:hypothetical protein